MSVVMLLLCYLPMTMIIIILLVVGSGYDMFSNKIINIKKNEISKQLTLIINQMLESGIFPGSLQIVK